jgi:DNA-binding MarR family transcriptional regulator
VYTVEVASTRSKQRVPEPSGSESTVATFPPLESRAVFLLSQIGHYTAATFSERLAPLKIQPRHFAVMNGLATHDGATQQQLADTLAIHRNVMVGVVDDLERHGYAKREPHPGDRRAHAVRLTARGRTILKSAHATANALESDVTDVFAAGDRGKFIDSLQRLAESLGLAPGSHPSLRDQQ